MILTMHSLLERSEKQQKQIADLTRRNGELEDQLEIAQNQVSHEIVRLNGVVEALEKEKNELRNNLEQWRKASDHDFEVTKAIRKDRDEKDAQIKRLEEERDYYKKQSAQFHKQFVTEGGHAFDLKRQLAAIREGVEKLTVTWEGDIRKDEVLALIDNVPLKASGERDSLRDMRHAPVKTPVAREGTPKTELKKKEGVV